MKSKEDSKVAAHAEAVRQMVDPLFEQQLKLYEQAVQHFQQQKFVKAKELLEKVQAGPGKELADRARVHLRIVDQRMKIPGQQIRLRKAIALVHHGT